MARHLVPPTVEHFNELSKRITFSGQLEKRSAFNRNEFLKAHVRNGEIRYAHAYKTTISDLGRLPMYAMVDGVHHPKWVGVKRDVTRAIGSKLFNILMRNTSAMSGAKANLVHSVLNETRNYNYLHRGLLALPFALNPAACSLNQEDTAAFAEESLNNIAQLSEHFYTLREIVEYKGTYNELHSSLGRVTRGGHFTNFTFKKGVISVCYGALVDFERKKVLAMLTLNRDFQEYFLLHKYSQSSKKLHPQIFNIVVDEEFRRNSGEHYAIELWTMVRKGMCDIVEEGVSVETIDGGEFFTELYGNMISNQNSKPLGPLEQIEQNAEMQQKFLQSTATANTLRARNIVLID